jgi:hypothetical protein
MKATELRIGNLIIEKGKIKNVRSVSGENAKDYSKIEPIPLTEELLLKCNKYVKWQWFGSEHWGGYIDFVGGWKLMIRFWHGEFLFEIVRIDKKLDCYVGIKKLKLKIKHFHQLQNFYFALTGEELTIQ